MNFEHFKQIYETSSFKNKLGFWIILYVLAVSIMSGLILIISYPLQNDVGHWLNQDDRKMYQEAYNEGSLAKILCGNTNQDLSKKYDKQHTREILTKSGILNNSARLVASENYFSGGSIDRYEPKQATRPSLILSNDSMEHPINLKYCLVDIIE